MFNTHQHLTRLEELGLIRVAQLEPQIEYLFRHALVQDASYGSLLRQDRKRLHRQVGDALEDAYSDRHMELAAIIARHYQLGEAWEKAVDYLVLAGDRAAALVANADAKSLYESALEALAHLPEDTKNQRRFADIVLKLARVSSWLPSEHIPDLHKQALKLAEELGDETLQARVMGSLGAYHYVRGQTAESLQWFERCIPLAEPLGLDDVLLVPYNILGRTMIFANDPRAQEFLAKGISLAEKFNDKELLSGTLGIYSNLLFSKGKPEEALIYVQRALEVAHDLGAVRVAGTLTMLGANASILMHDHVVEYLTQGIQLAEENNRLQPLYMCLGALGCYYAQRGETELARINLERSLDIARRDNRFMFVPLYQACLADLNSRTADPAEVIAQAQAALEIAAKTGQHIFVALIQPILAKIIVQTEPTRWEEAQMLIDQSISAFNNAQIPANASVSLYELGKLYAQCGHIDEARTKLNEAAALFEQFGMAWYHEQAKEALAKLENGKN